MPAGDLFLSGTGEVIEVPAIPASSSPMSGALIHVAREEGLRTDEGRNAQGERRTSDYVGPWVACRFMEVGVAAERPRGDGSSSTDRRYELLVDVVNEFGEPYLLRSAMRMLVYAPPVTDPTGWIVEIAGDPERLNDGVEVIGWMANAARVEDTR